MAKPELGTKRQCRSCGNRFYDLNRDPILCPKCGAVFQLQDIKPISPEVGEAAAEDETKLEAATGPEIVSLEEAEGTTTDKAIETDDEVEAAEDSGADEAFLEEEEEGDDDVSTLIDGDIEDDEEA
ncbi:MAG: TIGR02300 family protein [Hyphomicrobiales bacterium]|nr:TIGR02300 family protein [Hyphomicrobiales bacterium]MBV8770624.1 TIGR02300 family protein [Hyphomicrobiales bacterium]MBV9053999.1 TIGR02300 family protein [Hyphomicrobiales bacterium]MBV9137057.1 TIGR02300 family protein [Hyphomicrobiales bacterium]MBV9591766.1 TIGR02300 family protein [Hyphomicrobiales bacterium]